MGPYEREAGRSDSERDGAEREAIVRKEPRSRDAGRL